MWVNPSRGPDDGLGIRLSSERLFSSGSPKGVQGYGAVSVEVSGATGRCVHEERLDAADVPAEEDWPAGQHSEDLSRILQRLVPRFHEAESGLNLAGDWVEDLLRAEYAPWSQDRLGISLVLTLTGLSRRELATDCLRFSRRKRGVRLGRKVECAADDKGQEWSSVLPIRKLQ